ncbi:MAG: NAD(P)H-dependent oxidoreductase [Bacteroidales bacterium]|nr:NAD(P)H-dependent oxidoreductase [Bacteroidales bacterium]
MTMIIDALEWRYATKIFDKTKKLKSNQLVELEKIVQLSASSFGLQPYKVLIISNQELKDKLKSASFGQLQISDASHLFLFCSMIDFNKNDVDAFVDLNVKTTGNTKDSFKMYHEMMDMKIGSMNTEENASWAARQSYIALGNLLTAAAEMKIDICPIEGFVPQSYSEILNLNEMGLKPIVIAAIGFRSDEDKYQHSPKVRKSTQDLFIHI